MPELQYTSLLLIYSLDSFWLVVQLQCAQVARINTAHPYIWAFVENRPFFCDLVQVQSVIELFGKQVNNAQSPSLNVH